MFILGYWTEDVLKKWKKETKNKNKRNFDSIFHCQSAEQKYNTIKYYYRNRHSDKVKNLFQCRHSTFDFIHIYFHNTLFHKQMKCLIFIHFESHKKGNYPHLVRFSVFNSRKTSSNYSYQLGPNEKNQQKHRWIWLEFCNPHQSTECWPENFLTKFHLS